MSADSEALQTLQEAKFYLHYINFIPYVDSAKKKTKDILFVVLTFLNQEHIKGKAYVRRTPCLTWLHYLNSLPSHQFRKTNQEK
jgi:hypothetical protein